MAESSRSDPAPLTRALDLARSALGQRPAGLLTDFDGTLSPIVADPGSARLADGAGAALEALVGRLAVVAVVTGRAPVDARRMTGVPGLLVAGNHGTEWLEPGAETPVTSPDAVRVRHLLAGVLDRVPSIDGVTVEDKGISATVHYRNVTDPAGASDRLLRALGSMPEGLELRRGRMSLELRPVGLGDKGAATRAIIERHGLRGVVVMGDDITDLDMFAAVEELRSEGRLRGAVIGVGGADAEIPPEVIAASDVVLPQVDDAARFLQALAAEAWSDSTPD